MNFGGHNYISGATVIAIGGFIMVGGITGNLAPMFAALFAPRYLDVTDTNGQTPLTQSTATKITNDFINNIINELPLGPIKNLWNAL